jgi:ectoine hydroxylase-related dioxygenase (phytanoyl-CoA dioxygenase family)
MTRTSDAQRFEADSFQSAIPNYRRYGFSVIRRLLDPELLRPMQAAAADQLKSRGVTDGTATSKGQLRYVARDAEESSDFLLSEASGLEAVEECFQSAELLEGVGTLLGTDEVFSHPNKYLRAVPPWESLLSYPAGVHQDYPELQGSPNQLTMWVPLFSATEETGCLPIFESLAPASILPMRLADNPSGWEVRPEVLGRRHAFDFEPGDVLVFNTFTPHGGSRNEGEGIRVSLESRYQPLSDPICEANLTRPTVAVDWDTHYADWTGQWRHYWQDRHPRTIAFGDSWERWRDIESLKEGLRGNVDALGALQIAVEFGRDPAVRATAKRLFSQLAVEAETLASVEPA